MLEFLVPESLDYLDQLIDSVTRELHKSTQLAFCG